MIVDAYSHVCPERLLDAISQRHPGTEVAALRKNSVLDTIRSLGLSPAGQELLLGAKLHRIMRL